MYKPIWVWGARRNSSGIGEFSTPEEAREAASDQLSVGDRFWVTDIKRESVSSILLRTEFPEDIVGLINRHLYEQGFGTSVRVWLNDAQKRIVADNTIRLACTEFKYLYYVDYKNAIHYTKEEDNG